MTILDQLWSQIDKGKNGQNIGKSTGMSKLDKIIGGIQPHRYYLIGAASSVGKTSYILYIIYNLLKQETEDAPVYFIYFSLEIGADILLAKLMALYCAEEFGIYLTINDILSFETPLTIDIFILTKSKINPKPIPQKNWAITKFIDLI